MLPEKFDHGRSVKNKKIVVLATGGTILSVYNASQNRIALQLNGSDFLNPILNDVPNTKVDVQDYSQIPGPHLSVNIALEVAAKIEELQSEYDGVVVLQGTDTIEEFSYLISLITSVSKPVVFTGAMKSNNEYYRDGLGNVVSAIQVACCQNAYRPGVLVVFNERIYTAEDVIKMDTQNMDSFQGRTVGPIGSVSGGRPQFFWMNHHPQPYEKSVESKVVLLKVALGNSERLLDYCLDDGIRGIVIEGFGAGNVLPEWEKGIERAVNYGVPVMISSRCPKGNVTPIYDSTGGGKSLERKGAIFAAGLSGVKARIKLMVLLGQSKGFDMEEIRYQFI